MSECSWVPDPPEASRETPQGDAPAAAEPAQAAGVGGTRGSDPAATGEDVGSQHEPARVDHHVEGEQPGGRPGAAAGEEAEAFGEEAMEGGRPPDRLAEVTAERDEYLDALRRLQADFENYRKRIIRQQTEHLERAAFDLVAKLLPVLDTIDLALAHAGGGAPDDGLTQVAATANDVLSREGLERLDPLGEPFDPVLHEAVAHEEAPEAGEKPVVSEVLRPGYRWKGQLLRPAMVKVCG